MSRSFDPRRGARDDGPPNGRMLARDQEHTAPARNRRWQVAPPPHLWGRDGVGGRADRGTHGGPANADALGNEWDRAERPPSRPPPQGGRRALDWLSVSMRSRRSERDQKCKAAA